MDTDTARARLQEMLTDLDSSEHTLRDEDAGASSELSHYDQHQADSASELADADREDAMIERIDGQRQQVRQALARIEQGTYGRCVDCGRQLSDDRLDARPEAARCVECQSKLEAAR